MLFQRTSLPKEWKEEAIISELALSNSVKAKLLVQSQTSFWSKRTCPNNTISYSIIEHGAISLKAKLLCKVIIQGYYQGCSHYEETRQ